MDKLHYVFEQVMITDGSRELPDTSIGKTFRVCYTDWCCYISSPLQAAEYLIKFIIQSRLIYDK